MQPTPPALGRNHSSNPNKNRAERMRDSSNSLLPVPVRPMPPPGKDHTEEQLNFAPNMRNMQDISTDNASVGVSQPPPPQQQQQPYGVVGGFSSHLHVMSHAAGNVYQEPSTDIGYSAAFGDRSDGIHGSQSVAESVVSNLWTRAAACHHPLQLQLQHSSLAEVYYLPLKAKKRPELKLDFESSSYAPSSSRSAGNAPTRSSTATATATAGDGATSGASAAAKALRKRVESMLKKEPLFGKEKEIAARLLAPYAGDGDSQKMARSALTKRVHDTHVRRRKEKAVDLLRTKAIADGTYVDDDVMLGLKKHPDVLAAEKAEEEMQEFLRNDDGSAAFDETQESCYADLWADSGTLTGCIALKKFQRKICCKRWLVSLTTLLFQARLQQSLAAAHEQERLLLEETTRYVWTELDTAAFVLQTQWKNAMCRRAEEKSALQLLKWHRNIHLMALLQANLGSTGAVSERQNGLGSAFSRTLLQTRSDAADMMIDFMREVYRSNRLKSTIMIFCNGIRHLQGLIKRHLRSNRARMQALTAAFDSFSARLTNHISVLNDNLGLDLIRHRNSKSTSIVERTAARKAQADKRAILKLLRTDVLIGKISLDPHVRCLQNMKSSSFHKLLRRSVLPRRNREASTERVARPEAAVLSLEELDYQLKMHQGHFMLQEPLYAVLEEASTESEQATIRCKTVASGAQSVDTAMLPAAVGASDPAHVTGGVLIDPSIRDEVLWEFLIKRRKEFVAKLGHKFRTGDIVQKKLPKARRLLEKSHSGLQAGVATAADTSGAETISKKQKKQTNMDLAEVEEEDEEEEEEEDGQLVNPSIRITLDQVRGFIQGDGLGNEGTDPLATKLEVLHAKVAESQRVREWQRRTKMCNLTSLTTWSTMIRDLRTADLLNLYLEMVHRTQVRRAQLGLPFPGMH